MDDKRDPSTKTAQADSRRHGRGSPTQVDRAEALAATGARVTVLRPIDFVQGRGGLLNFGLGDQPAELEADRRGIEWVGLGSRGVRSTRELAGWLDRLRPDLVHLDSGWLLKGAAATRLHRMSAVVVTIDDATASEVLDRPRLAKMLSVLLSGPNSRALFSTEATAERAVAAGLVRPGRAAITDGNLERTLDVYAACLGHPPVTLTAN